VRIESRLPQQVVQQGISVFKSTGTFLMLVALTSTEGKRDSVALSDYINRYILRDLRYFPLHSRVHCCHVRASIVDQRLHDGRPDALSVYAQHELPVFGWQPFQPACF